MAPLPAGQDARLPPWGEEGGDLTGLRRDFPDIGAQSLQTGQGGADIPTDAPARMVTARLNAAAMKNRWA